MQRQRMHRPLQLLLQHLVEPLMALYLAQPAELVCNYDQLEMRIGAWTCMLVAFIFKLQQRRLQCSADFLFDGGSDSHGKTDG